MPVLDAFGRDYLRLVLQIDRHIPGYIDAYYGPAEIRAEVLAAPLRPPAGLLADVQGLREHIPAADPARQAYLVAQLRAIEGTLRMLNGEAMDYLEEVATLYDIKPGLRDEESFVEAHRKLDELLPRFDGMSSLGDRRTAWRKQFEIDPAAAMPLLEMTRAETRRRSAAFVALPEQESVELQLTGNQPWSAYNWYKGNGHSLIEFNTDNPLNVLDLLNTFAHEGYPGHHTEAILKEAALYEEKGYAEQSAVLLHSPMAVISEGIAVKALEVIFPEGTAHDWVAAELLPAAGMAELAHDYPPAWMREVSEAGRALAYVANNAAILLYNGQNTPEQTVKYIMDYGLAPRNRAEKSLQFMTHPLYRSYGFSYTHGYDLINDTAVPNQTFYRLLTEQILPSQLAAESIHGNP